VRIFYQNHRYPRQWRLANYLSGFKIMNPISFNPNFGRILLLSTALIVSINTIAGGRSSERNLMDDF
jgi:hypothetical protein